MTSRFTTPAGTFVVAATAAAAHFALFGCAGRDSEILAVGEKVVAACFRADGAHSTHSPVLGISFTQAMYACVCLTHAHTATGKTRRCVFGRVSASKVRVVCTATRCVTLAITNAGENASGLAAA